MAKKKKIIEEYTQEELMRILNIEINPKDRAEKPVPFDELLLKTINFQANKKTKKK